MKGIVLAGGSGTRLHSCYHGIFKATFACAVLLVYYPLSVLVCRD